MKAIFAKAGVLPGAILAMMASGSSGAADAPDSNPYAREQAIAVAKAKTAEALADKHYVAPRNGYGQPDLEGNWTNVSITPLERARQFGNNLNLTAEQAATLEGAAIDHYIEGNAPTDPNAPATDTTRKHCQGAGGLDCGYNSAWKDSATTLARIDGQPHSSFITSTPDGRIPAYRADYTGPRSRVVREEGEGAATGGRGLADNPEDRGLGERCLTAFGNSGGPVMLPVLYNNNYAFAQSRDSVAIVVEMVHDVRMIHLGAAHRSDGVRPWFGDSIGHYEGNTLVVETTNYPKAQAFRGAWKDLKVTERFTRKGPHRMLYQFTVADPTVWELPWSGEYEFTSSKGQLYEYACHEGNYGLEGILAGARAEEAAVATKNGATEHVRGQQE
jgi:hypothetical protein